MADRQVMAKNLGVGTRAGGPRHTEPVETCAACARPFGAVKHAGGSFAGVQREPSWWRRLLSRATGRYGS